MIKDLSVIIMLKSKSGKIITYLQMILVLKI